MLAGTSSKNGRNCKQKYDDDQWLSTIHSSRQFWMETEIPETGPANCISASILRPSPEFYIRNRFLCFDRPNKSFHSHSILFKLLLYITNIHYLVSFTFHLLSFRSSARWNPLSVCSLVSDKAEMEYSSGVNCQNYEYIYEHLFLYSIISSYDASSAVHKFSL